MLASRQAQDKTTALRFPKPKLTIDTQAPPKAGVDSPCTQSAPAGTRQEKGIPLMYRADDRHCAKVSEMMKSPSWRSQLHGPVMVEDRAPCSPVMARRRAPNLLDSNSSDNAGPHHRKKHKIDGETDAGSPTPRPCGPLAGTGEITLGQDGEAVKILSIHPFPETPDAPGNTFLISAAICPTATEFHDAVCGEIQPVRTHNIRTEKQRKTVKHRQVSRKDCEYGFLRASQESVQSGPQSISRSPNNVRAADEKHQWSLVKLKESTRAKEHGFREHADRNETIESHSHEHTSRHHRERSGQEDTRRFRDLLGRLQEQLCEMACCQIKKPAINDPAIISFALKDNQACVSNGFMAQLRAAGEQYTRSRHHARSDSGYATSPALSKLSTHAQSRDRQDMSDGTASAQIEKTGSQDLGLDTASKYSTLDPTAKEFSSARLQNGSPVQRNGLVRPLIPVNAYLPPEPHLDFGVPGFGVPGFGVPGFGIPAFGVPGLGLSGLPTSGSPEMGLNMNQTGLSHSGVFINTDNFGSKLPPPTGLGVSATFPAVGVTPGIPPGLTGLAMPSGSILPSLAPVPGLVPPSGHMSTGGHGAFHQQLPAAPTCNNPAHQNIPTFGSNQGHQISAIPQLPPPAPPASLLRQSSDVQMPRPTAVAPLVNPIFRKNVPKPKVPNTTGQQYWEYWHELRRTFEPGYAQKSKQNQQKRFMKQQQLQNHVVTAA